VIARQACPTAWINAPVVRARARRTACFTSLNASSFSEPIRAST
jgi:hypothetical protein